jgi:membrane protease YdiL (CAAX protease family)
VSRPKRYQALRWVLAGLILGVLLTLTSVVPFALAGLTGDDLWISAPVVLLLAYVLVREAPRCVAYYRSLWPSAWRPALGWAVLALALTGLLVGALSLLPANPVLDWSLGSVFHVGAAAGENGFAVPLSVPWLALLYALPALLALPLLAFWEEEIFRRGTKGWSSALVRSTLFGLAHLTSGVSLGVCGALGAAGLVFTFAYWHGVSSRDAMSARTGLPARVRERLLPIGSGVWGREEFGVYRATQAHMLYNVIGVCAILVFTLLERAR